MSYIGIDFGKKRVGVAYSDESNHIAVPHGILKNDASLFDELKKILQSRHPEKIILGRSIDLKGNENKVQKDIEVFKTKLSTIFPSENIAYQDEYLTSAHVEVKNDMLDASAAALILQRYLEREKFINKTTPNS